MIVSNVDTVGKVIKLNSLFFNNRFNKRFVVHPYDLQQIRNTKKMLEQI